MPARTEIDALQLGQCRPARPQLVATGVEKACAERAQQAAAAIVGGTAANRQNHPLRAGIQRCASLASAGLVQARGSRAQGDEALAHLRAAGWSDAALRAATLSTAFDLWRSVAVTYASAYAGTGPDAMPCHYAFATLGPDGKPRPSTPAERIGWWADGSGIPPGNGIGIVDGLVTHRCFARGALERVGLR